ncbi:transporter [Flavobacterium sp. D11R37]|uniref:OmpP1/FadL family transporter n=1 Tax=Flavobacterium coralii TaxID=2838017 RepID=UPI001CA631EF|nr:outer membrane protein transport protein [Flavobacterium coralii]MBY8962686.1 transporter [Flavobacterium coralii]
MKKYIFLAALGLGATGMYAQRQDPNTAADAMRYTTESITGTARFRAMGGAFGALGGDPSAIMINPAGSAVFNYNSGTMSLSVQNVRNEANYFGTGTTENDSSFDLNQMGAVFVFNNADENAVMNKFTLGFNYENLNNFDNRIYYRGVNPTNSLDSYFLNYANGVPLSNLTDSYYEQLSYNQQQAYLGYNAYIFDPLSQSPNNTGYTSNYDATAANFYQDNIVNTTGFHGKVALNFGAQLKKRLYVGANINVHFTDYIQTSSFYEDANAPQGLRSIEFNNERYTYGGGVSFNLGTILKITEDLRAGVAYESPTWLRLQDEVTQNLRSYCPECGVNGESNFDVNPFITFVLDDYTLRTPSKWTGSLAYVFGKSGLLSVDYSMRDYGNTKYISNGYSDINFDLSNTLGRAGELRVGAEYRVKAVSFRGGYRYAESPYKDGHTMGDLTGISGGIGVAFGSSRLDFAYAWQRRDMDYRQFKTGLTDPARIESTNNNFTLSYTLDL